MSDALKAEEKRRTFQTLDALRGLAAIEVMTRHCGDLFGGLILPESYLAVDLFFVMSGIVIAHAYENRLRSTLSAGRFIKLRIIRLYPLYIIGIGLGLIQLVAHLAKTHRLDGGVIISSAAIAALMIPPGILPALSGPRWSLFFEVLANLVYAFGIRLLTNAALLVIAALAAVGLIVTELTFQTLDVGFYWDWGLLGGLSRVCYSFFLGV